jgi:hypothetical protein
MPSVRLTRVSLQDFAGRLAGNDSLTMVLGAKPARRDLPAGKDVKAGKKTR